jgi:acyl carrier protein
MANEQRIRSVVYRTMTAVNDLLPAEQALEARDDLVLIGRGARLDSMGFVNFIVALEEELERELGVGVNIADLMSVQTDEGSAISTVGHFIRVLSDRLE